MQANDLADQLSDLGWFVVAPGTPLDQVELDYIDRVTQRERASGPGWYHRSAGLLGIGQNTLGRKLKRIRARRQAAAH